ncbi:MAG: hypothetical protein P4L85_19780 [Paludisphaera borealis]|uniref:hypothetical protein n=1 Tax=Paludisphaera borealis TaxID=1387353 RepID=UPI00284C4A07|nr:hypothetical protein [Paludisphaera borealis]MDR3621601.1 hypothetical protein [Paludisphaera borealis]
MAGSFDFDPYDAPLSSPAAAVCVCRYDASQAGDARYQTLPNVRCDQIQYREGPEPPAARFSYVLDDATAGAPAPADFGGLWPIDASGPYVVRNDDRLVVLVTSPSGAQRILFDGFAQSPQVDLTSRSQRVSFLALGAAVRCWDVPIGGRRQRNADDPRNGSVIAVELPSRFNPDGRPNCTPDGADVNQGDASASYPVFLDPNIDRVPDPRTFWTLGKFVRYVLSVYNDQTYVNNPDFERLDALLQSRPPINGSAFVDMDAGDAKGYSAADVVVRDFDATNSPWPEALAAQLDHAGFGLRFVTGEDGVGSPRNEIEIYRKDADDAGLIRELLLPDAGDDLNPARCNVAAMHLHRDTRPIVNAVTVETNQRRVELSVVLAPGFTPTAGDETATNRIQFLRANLAAAAGDSQRKYRYYVADEAGDGHWNPAASSWSNAALDLSPVFPNDDEGGPTYVKRLRPGSTSLVTRDAQGRRLRAQLALSRNYNGAAPAVWDGTGDWQPISGGWELLEDRLGVFVVVEDPEAWPIGDFTGLTAQEPSRTLRGVTSQANPSSPNTRFFLRLTTVVDDDLMLPAAVDARPASPTKFTRRRRVDARDHFGMETVAAHSAFNAAASPVTLRDDTPRALAWAEQLRSAHELPPMAGSVTVPSLITSYRVGDRVARINGRDVGLQTNVGADQGESPVYPVISALTWEFTADRQATVIELADARV